MKKKVRAGLIAVGVVIAAVFCVLVLASRNSNTAIPVGIQDDGVYYEMSRAELLVRKGKPDESDRSSLDNSVEYCYTEKIHGIESTVSYRFLTNWYTSNLCNVHVQIPVPDMKSSKALFEKINENMNEKYKTNPYYYNQGVTVTGQVKPVMVSEFGTDLGAIGVSVRITLADNKITIDAYDLF